MSSLYRPVAIGGRLIEGNLFLAPLAGFSDIAFRGLCAEYGSDMTYSEMLSAEGFIRNNRKTVILLERAENERNFGAQIFTGSPYSAARAVQAISGSGMPEPVLIDLNCGCPVPKVIRTGAGAALLKNPRFVYDVVKAMKENTSLPVSVKIRSGWDSGSVNYRETADAACQAGAALVCLHARTRSQGYTGAADWGQIRDLKERCPVPVFGSGDLYTPEDAKKMLGETGCDGLMFARGALGNPFIFRETRRLLESGAAAAPSPEERILAGLEHLERCVRAKGEALACREMRKHFAAYIKGLPGSAKFRGAVVQASTPEEYRRLATEYLGAVKNQAIY
jgi:nifR3 family TIM-barrel protein